MQRGLRNAASVFCWSVIGFGLCVMLGWWFHVPFLKVFNPGDIAAKGNTGLCFVLLGLALWVNCRVHSPTWNRIGVAACFLVCVIGVISLTEYLTGWNAGIDHLLFRPGPEDSVGSIRPPLMAAVTAVSFIFLSVSAALLNARSKSSVWGSQGLACAAFVVAIFGVLDPVLDPRTTHTHIAPLTPLVLALFAISIVLSRSEQGLGSLIASTTSGGTLVRRLLPAAVLVPMTVGYLRWRAVRAGVFSEWAAVSLMIVTVLVLLATVIVWTAHMLEEADRKQKREQENSVRLASIVTSSNEAIIGKTLDGTVVSWNPAAETMYGYTAEEMIGKSISVLIPPEHRRQFDSILEQVRRGEQIRPCDTERVRKDGTRVAVSLTAAPIRDAAGNLLGASTIARDITEQKRAQEELKRASLYARSLIDASLDPLVTISKDGKIMDVNRATELATGVTRAQLVGSDFCEYFSEPDEARAGYQRVFAEETIRDYPLAMRHVSGEITEVLYNASVFRNEAGAIEGVFAAARDVMQWRRSERALADRGRQQEAVANLGLLALSAPDLQSVMERAVSVLSEILNVEYCKVLELLPDGKALLLRAGVGWRPGLAGQATVDSIDSQAGYTLLCAEPVVVDDLRAETRFHGPPLLHDHGVISGMSVVIGGEAGMPFGVLGAHTKKHRKFADQDVRFLQSVANLLALAIAREKAHAALHKASAYARTLIEASLDPLVTISREGKITDVNDATVKVTGVERAHLIGSDFCDYFTEPEKAHDGYEQVFSEGFVQDYPLAIRNVSGEITDVLYNASIFRNETGAIEGVFAAARDITRRKEAERKLERVNRTLEAMSVCADALMRCTQEPDTLQRVCDAVVGTAGYRMVWVGYAEHDEQKTVRPVAWAGHEDGYVLDAHISWADAERGRGPTGVAIRTGKTSVCQDIAHDPLMVPWKEQALHRGYRASIVLPLRTETQTFGALSIYAAEPHVFDTRERQLLEELASNMTYAIAMLRANGALRQLNEELDERVRCRTAELQAANKELEAFSYSVSHDLRAPLRHISGFSKIVSEEFGPQLPEEAQRHLQRIQQGTRRMGQLIDDLLNLSRVGRRALQRQVASLENIVRQVLSDLQPDCDGRDVQWNVGRLPFVECDAALLKQVLQNLLSNALKFTRPRHRAVIDIGYKQEEGAPVVFVRDNGVGFNMRYASKLFGVFQRMHRAEDFEGTGVGLATVQRIVQKHGGQVWAEAQLDKGATFYFSLSPLDKTHQEFAPPEEETHALAGH